jgi:WD40 repeat protein
MSTCSRGRLFISYAHKDGKDLALRLQQDLQERGLDAWLDRQRLDAGASWTEKIETALDVSEIVLALLTPGSYISDICRAEQLRSLRKGKRVIPILGQKNTDIPLHLETKNYRDFTVPANYANSLKQLLEDISDGEGFTLHKDFRDTYVTAPPLPANFVPRPEVLAALRAALITDAGTGQIGLTALEGMGGIGKTVLAQALCQDEVVQQAFPDGIIWVTAGRESIFDIVTRMREVGKALKDDLTRYDTELGSKNQYRSTIRLKAALIVVDDVWKVSDIEPLRAESSPRSRMLFTTRDASIAAAVGAHQHTANLLTVEQSREVLANWSGIESTKLPPAADDLIHECGRLPLALSMTGAMLRNKPSALWSRTVELLRHSDLEKIKAQFPDYPHPNLFRAIQVSVDALDPTTRERYLALAVMPQEMTLHPVIQQTLWNLDDGQALETAEQFIDLSLAQRDTTSEGIRLHDLQFDYVRTQYAHANALEVIHGAVRLSAHVIGNDPRQFASQVLGRLLPLREAHAIQRFMNGIAVGAPRPWLMPLQPGLEPPGGTLLRTLEGHSWAVNGVAVTPDGRRAVSASEDTTLKVWDLDSGVVLRTLEGHFQAVYGVAVTPDGRRAVSASGDTTLKVWDLDSGVALRTLKGHTYQVNGVTVTPDGKRAVSASVDRTLKVWDLDTGVALRTLEGHSQAVYGVAVTPDGRRAVSASGDTTLKVWDLDSGVALRTLKGHSQAVYGVAVTPDGRRAVAASLDRTLTVWDLESGVTLRRLEGHFDSVLGVAVTPDGSRAASASYDKTLEVWDLDTGVALRTLKSHLAHVNGVAVTADGKRAVSASDDKTLKVWDLDQGAALRTLEENFAAVSGVSVTPDGRWAVSSSWYGTLKVWDLDTGVAMRALESHSSWVSGVSVTPDGKRAVSASYDRTLKVWNLDTGVALRTLGGHSAAVLGVSLTPDGKRAVSASYDRTLKVWDLDRGALRTLEGHAAAVLGVSVTPDGKRAVSASDDKTLKVWDLDTGVALRTLEGHSEAVNGVAVTPDGKRAVSASYDRTLKVWNLDTGVALRTLEGHAAAVLGVSVTPDGRRAVSASYDRTLKVWDLDRGVALATFTCDGIPHSCAFIDDHKLIAGDTAGRVYFLQLEE